MLAAVVINVDRPTDLLADMVRFYAAAGARRIILLNALTADDLRTPGAWPEDCEVEQRRFHGAPDLHQRWLLDVRKDIQNDYPGQWYIFAELGEFYVPRGRAFTDYFDTVPCDAESIIVATKIAVARQAEQVPHPRHATLFEISTECAVLSRSSLPTCTSQTSACEPDPGLTLFRFPNIAQHVQPVTLDLDSITPADREVTVFRLKGRVVEDLRLRTAIADGQWPVTEIDPMLEEMASHAEHLAQESFLRFVPHTNPETGLDEVLSPPVLSRLSFFAAGAFRQATLLREFGASGAVDGLVKDFRRFRDIYSLAPGNDLFHNALKTAAHRFFPSSLAQLARDTKGKTIILHLSCVERLDRAIASMESFGDDDAFHNIILTGKKQETTEDTTPFDFSYNGTILSVPVSDAYEAIHSKLFYAYLVLSLLDSCPYVVKVDDDIHLDDRKRFEALISGVKGDSSEVAGHKVGDIVHEKQLHGWHIGKVANQALNSKGYQYPVARCYPAGGFGYVLGPAAISACAHMYLVMKAFFDIDAIGLEDVCVGHAIHGWDLDMTCVMEIDSVHRTIPGLKIVN